MSFKKQLFLICGVLAVPFLGLQADDVNVALRKPVTASSQQEKFPASNVTDGVISRKSTWMSAESARPPHMLIWSDIMISIRLLSILVFRKMS